MAAKSPIVFSKQHNGPSAAISHSGRQDSWMPGISSGLEKKIHRLKLDERSLQILYSTIVRLKIQELSPNEKMFTSKHIGGPALARLGRISEHPNQTPHGFQQQCELALNPFIFSQELQDLSLSRGLSKGDLQTLAEALLKYGLVQKNESTDLYQVGVEDLPQRTLDCFLGKEEGEDLVRSGVLKPFHFEEDFLRAAEDNRIDETLLIQLAQVFFQLKVLRKDPEKKAIEVGFSRIPTWVLPELRKILETKGCVEDSELRSLITSYSLFGIQGGMDALTERNFARFCLDQGFYYIEKGKKWVSDAFPRRFLLDIKQRCCSGRSLEDEDFRSLLLNSIPKCILDHWGEPGSHVQLELIQNLRSWSREKKIPLQKALENYT